MDTLKEAFQKVKQDISSLRQDLDYLKYEVDDLNNILFEIRDLLSTLNEREKQVNSPKTEIPLSPTNQHIIPLDQQITPTQPIDSSTDPLSFKALKDQNIVPSTGNKGVPTDRQTDQQTDRQIISTHILPENSLENASKILDSLDSLKKEIRLKFKRLTERELSVFSALYQLDDEKGYADYKSIAEKLKLTESSIRDYIGRLVEKGIPVDKIKVNNKTIHLKISESLKQLATLSTILQLRDL